MMKKNKFKPYILFNIIIILIVSVAVVTSMYLNNELSVEEYFLTSGFIFSFTLQMSFVFFISNIAFIYFRRLQKEKIQQLEDVPIVTCIWGLSGKLLYANKEARNIFEVLEDDIQSFSIHDYLSKDEKEKALKNVKKLLLNADKDPVDIAEYKFIVKSGKEYDLLTYTRKFSINSFITFAIDNTLIKSLNENLKIASHELSERNEFLSLLVEGLPKPMMYLDRNLNIKFVSNLFKETFGLTLEDLETHPEETFMSKNFKENTSAVRAALYEKKPSEADDVVIVNGRKRFVHFDIVPDSTENPNGVFVFIHDTTEELIVKKKLEYSNKLNESLFQISEMLINISDQSKIAESFENVFKNIADTLRAEKVYTLKFENSKINVYNEYNKGFINIYKGKSIKLNESQVEYYKHKFKEVGIYDCKSSPHGILFEPKFCANVYMKNDNEEIVFGVAKINGNKNFNSIERKYIQSVGYIINETKKRIKHYEELKIQEETLNTLLDKTDLGIIISGLDNKIHYINHVAENMFKISENDNFVIEKYVNVDDRDKIVKFLKERSIIKKKEVDIKTIQGVYLKIYSSQIDYEDTKAYLTIITDVTKYIQGE